MKKGVKGVKREGAWKGALYGGGDHGVGKLRTLGTRAGAAAAVGGAGYAAYRHHKKKKQSSALDVLAEQRALELLAENGIDPNQVKTSASREEILGNAVEQRAFQMLAEAGYIQDE